MRKILFWDSLKKNTYLKAKNDEVFPISIQLNKNP